VTGQDSLRPSGGRGGRAVRAAKRRVEASEVRDPEVILAAALRFLEERARSVHEVRRRLARAGYPPDSVEDTLTRLLELGMLDDQAFARAWVESRDRARPRGERALRAELRAKLVDDAIIEQVLEERQQLHRDGAPPTPAEAGGASGPDPAARDADELAAARLLIRSERQLLRVADLRRRRQRAWAILARAGFDSDTAREAMLEAERRWAVDEAADEPPD
jgi:regulatory protein